LSVSTIRNHERVIRRVVLRHRVCFQTTVTGPLFRTEVQQETNYSGENCTEIEGVAVACMKQMETSMKMIWIKEPPDKRHQYSTRVTPF
jgi:hypothetical protein